MKAREAPTPQPPSLPVHVPGTLARRLLEEETARAAAPMADASRFVVLRWIAVLPAAALAEVVTSKVVAFAAMGRDDNPFWVGVVATGWAGAAVPFVGAIVAPSARRIVACVLGGVMVLFSLYTAWDLPEPELLDYFELTSGAIGAGAVAISAWYGKLDF